MAGMATSSCSLLSDIWHDIYKEFGDNEEIIKIVTAKPSEIAACNNQGLSSMHLAIMSSGRLYEVFDENTSNLIKIMLKTNPAAASVPNSNGDVPAHLLIRFGWPLDVIKEFIGMHPESLLTANNQGMLPLHDAVKLYESGVRGDDVSQNDYLMNLSVIKFLIAECPSSAGVRDCFGRTPLHVASASRPCMWIDPENVLVQLVQLVAEANVSSALIPDNEGRLPLHIAIEAGFGRKGAGEYAGRTRWKQFLVVMYLIETFPEAAAVRDAQGRLPLELAIEKGSELEVLDALVAAFPQAGREQPSLVPAAALAGITCASLSALLEAMYSTRESAETGLAQPFAQPLAQPARPVDLGELLGMSGALVVAEALLRAPPDALARFLSRCPAAARTPLPPRLYCAGGGLLLHVAALCGARRRTLEVVAKAYPGALTLPDADGFTPLALAARSSAAGAVAVLRALLHSMDKASRLGLITLRKLVATQRASPLPLPDERGARGGHILSRLPNVPFLRVLQFSDLGAAWCEATRRASPPAPRAPPSLWNPHELFVADAERVAEWAAVRARQPAAVRAATPPEPTALRLLRACRHASGRPAVGSRGGDQGATPRPVLVPAALLALPSGPAAALPDLVAAFGLDPQPTPSGLHQFRGGQTVSADALAEAIRVARDAPVCPRGEALLPTPEEVCAPYDEAAEWAACFEEFARPSCPREFEPNEGTAAAAATPTATAGERVSQTPAAEGAQRQAAARLDPCLLPLAWRAGVPTLTVAAHAALAEKLREVLAQAVSAAAAVSARAGRPVVLARDVAEARREGGGLLLGFGPGAGLWTRGIFLVLEQVRPGMSMTPEALAVLSDCLTELLRRLLESALMITAEGGCEGGTKGGAEGEEGGVIMASDTVLMESVEKIDRVSMELLARRAFAEISDGLVLSEFRYSFHQILSKIIHRIAAMVPHEGIVATTHVATATCTQQHGVESRELNVGEAAPSTKRPRLECAQSPLDVSALQKAVKLILPGELAKHAHSEGNKKALSTGGGTGRKLLCFHPAQVSAAAAALCSVVISEDSPALRYVAGVIEYMCGEVLELAANSCSEDRGASLISPRHLFVGLANDSEFADIFLRKGTVVRGSVNTRVHFMRSADLRGFEVGENRDPGDEDANDEEYDDDEDEVGSTQEENDSRFEHARGEEGVSSEIDSDCDADDLDRGSVFGQRICRPWDLNQSWALHPSSQGLFDKFYERLRDPRDFNGQFGYDGDGEDYDAPSRLPQLRTTVSMITGSASDEWAQWKTGWASVAATGRPRPSTPSLVAVASSSPCVMRRRHAALEGLSPRLRRLVDMSLYTVNHVVSEIRAAQSSGEPSLSVAEFQDLFEKARDAAGSSIEPSRSWTPDAMQALQCVVEADLVAFLEDGATFAAMTWGDVLGRSDLAHGACVSESARRPGPDPTAWPAVRPAAFRDVVFEVAAETSLGHSSWTKGAMDAVQRSAEGQVTGLLRAAALFTAQRPVGDGSGVKFEPKDLQSAQKLCREVHIY